MTRYEPRASARPVDGGHKLYARQSRAAMVARLWGVVPGHGGVAAHPHRYDMGATDLLDVLQLQAKQLDTRFDLITIRNDRLANRVALHLALGGGFTPPANP